MHYQLATMIHWHMIFCMQYVQLCPNMYNFTIYTLTSVQCTLTCNFDLCMINIWRAPRGQSIQIVQRQLAELRYLLVNIVMDEFSSQLNIVSSCEGHHDGHHESTTHSGSVMTSDDRVIYNMLRRSAAGKVCVCVCSYIQRIYQAVTIEPIYMAK